MDSRTWVIPNYDIVIFDFIEFEHNTSFNTNKYNLLYFKQ